MPAPTVVTAEARALAYELAQLLNSEASLNAMLDTLIRDAMPRAFANDPNLAQLEQRYPGITRFVIHRVEPELRRSALADLPQSWTDIGVIYASALSLSDLRESLAFFRGEAGTRLVAAMAEGFNFDQIAADALRNPDGAVSPGAFGSALRGSVTSLTQRASAADLQALNRFSLTPAGARMRMLTPRLAAYASQAMNRRDAANEAIVERIMEQAMRDFIARKPSRPSA